MRGDLRFASHGDELRLLSRVVRRAELPVRHSRGFNPRPVLSLVCPRPTSVASEDELLVLGADEARPGPDAVDRLNAAAIPGLHFTRAMALAPKRPPRPAWMDFELPLDASRAAAAAGRLSELADQERWLVRREKPGRGRSPGTSRSIDLRPLTEGVRLERRRLLWRQVPADPLWARPAEVLDLLGLDPQVDLASTVRTAVGYEPPLPWAEDGPLTAPPDETTEQSAAYRGPDTKEERRT